MIYHNFAYSGATISIIEAMKDEIGILPDRLLLV